MQLHRKSIISEKVHLVPSALDVTSEIETLLSCYWKIPGGSVYHRHCVHLFFFILITKTIKLIAHIEEAFSSTGGLFMLMTVNVFVT